ncbi:MAG: acyl-CoA dehydrogenase family protein [Halomonas sp.]|uniref:acyl-CoA dehydrogenase family protein n=1 Tax=Halomonas sp. TaxID=1486246 RepID=UPI003F90F0E3
MSVDQEASALFYSMIKRCLTKEVAPFYDQGEAAGEIPARCGMRYITEPHAGSDLASLNTRAKRTDEGWELSGSKIFITNGQHASDTAELSFDHMQLPHDALLGKVGSPSR